MHIPDVQAWKDPCAKLVEKHAYEGPSLAGVPDQAIEPPKANTVASVFGRGLLKPVLRTDTETYSNDLAKFSKPEPPFEPGDFLEPRVLRSWICKTHRMDSSLSYATIQCHTTKKLIRAADMDYRVSLMLLAEVERLGKQISENLLKIYAASLCWATGSPLKYVRTSGGPLYLRRYTKAIRKQLKGQLLSDIRRYHLVRLPSSKTL